jgi:tripartite-type tricarboxylate transporter receptor subunit TctC
LAPAGTPPQIIEKLGSALQAVLALEEIKSKFSIQGIDAEASTPGVYRATTEEQVRTWARVVEAAGIKAE